MQTPIIVFVILMLGYFDVFILMFFLFVEFSCLLFYVVYCLALLVALCCFFTL